MKATLRAVSPAEMARVRQQPDHLAQVRGEELTLEKTWHALHFLLCGQAWDGPDPWKHALLGGVEVDDGDSRVLGPEATARVAAGLSGVTGDMLLARLDLAQLEFAEIYPGGWGFGDFDWPTALRSDYAALQTFYIRRAAAGDAVLIRIA